MFPDYDHSLLALISSVLRYYGVNTPYSTLPAADSALTELPRNIVIMLFDGMGTAAVEAHLTEDAFLRRHMAETISSVFPPTTTAATITMETGLPPIAHGWLGWSLYFEELGDCVNLFPNTLTGGNGKKAADYHVARTLLPYKTVFERIREAAPDVHTHYVSPYTEYQAKTAAAVCRCVQTLCEAEGRHYIYAYHPQPDYDMHDLGTTHERVRAHITEINRCIEAMAGQLPDTLFFITADHGLTDTAWRPLYAFPDVTECLICRPSMETRAMSLFIKDGMQQQFRHAFEAHLGDIYTLYTKDEILENKCFGPGEPHPHAQAFIGDFIACANGDISIDPAEIPDPHPFRAAHGGLTSKEMNIPLMICNNLLNRL